MLVNHIVKIFLPLFLILNLVAAVRRAPFNVEYKGEGTLQERQIFRNSTNLIFGLFRSKNIISLVSQIPCEIIETLENDENEAERFFNEVESGQVPTLIENLPGEITGRIFDIVSIALSIPVTFIEGAQVIFEDTVEFFNAIEDGSILEKLEEFPGLIVSQITSGWGDFTSGLGDFVEIITCALGDCPTTEPAGICLTTTTTSSETSATPTFNLTSSRSPSASPSPSPIPTSTYVPNTYVPNTNVPNTYVPSSTAEGVATVTPTGFQSSTALPGAQGSGELVGLATPMQLSFKAAGASLIAALVGIIGGVLLL